MFFNDKQLTIIGGGESVKEGIEKDLWNKLQNKLTFGLNYSYKFFISTAQLFVDNDFYANNRLELAKLSLVLGKRHPRIEETDNLKLFNTTVNYDSTLKKGIYKASLCGLFALTLAVYLKPKQLFICGYDFGAKKIDNRRLLTHFYQGVVNHRGIGKTNYYTPLRAIQEWKCYPSENIYNVSLGSTITQFEKISYDRYFELLDSQTYNQDVLRTEIKKKLLTAK
jgi:hypothetical protein